MSVGGYHLILAPFPSFLSGSMTIGGQAANTEETHMVVRKQGLQFLSPHPLSHSPPPLCFSNGTGWMLERCRRFRAALMKDTSPKGEIINPANQGTFSWIYRNASLSCPINMSIFQAIFLSWEKCIIGVRWSICSLRIFTFMSLNSIYNGRVWFFMHAFSVVLKDGLCMSCHILAI